LRLLWPAARLYLLTKVNPSHGTSIMRRFALARNLHD
jgi:hypothetical protein